MHGKTLIDSLRSVEFKKDYSLQQNACGRLRGFGFNIDSKQMCRLKDGIAGNIGPALMTLTFFLLCWLEV